MMGLALILSIIIMLILYTDEYEVPAKQTYDGTIELSESSSLEISFSTMTVSGSVGPFTPTYLGTGFRWQHNGLDRVQGFYLSSGGSGRIIKIWDENWTLTEPIATDFWLDYQTMRNCTRMFVHNSDFIISATDKYTRVQIEDVKRGVDTIPLTFDVLRSNEFFDLDFTVVETSEDSSIGIRCNNPSFEIDSQNVQFNGTTQVTIWNFTGVQGSLSLGEDSCVEVFGDLALQFTSARVIGRRVDGVLSSPERGYALQGELEIVNSTRFSIDLDRDELEWSAQPEPVRVGALSEGGVAFTHETGQLAPASTAIFRSRLLDLDNTTRDVLSIVLSLCLGVLIYWLADEAKDALTRKEPFIRKGKRGIPWRTKMRMFKWFEPKKKRILGIITLVIVVALASVLVIYGVSYVVLAIVLGTEPTPYYFGEYDVNVNAYYEEGVDLELVNVTVSLFSDHVERLLDTDVSIKWERLPPDGKEYYGKNDLDPVGNALYNIPMTVLSGTIDYHIIFRYGQGLGFDGLNNGGPVTLIPVQDFEDPVLLLSTLMHEFGHALGLKHRTCSPLMTDNPSISEPRLPSRISYREGYTYRDVPIFERARDGTFAGFEDWGTEIARLMNRSVDLVGLNRTMTKNIYLYHDESTGEIHEVVYWKSEDYSTGDISETASIQRVPADAYSYALSDGEFMYVLMGLAGDNDARRAYEHYC